MDGNVALEKPHVHLLLYVRLKKNAMGTWTATRLLIIYASDGLSVV